MRTATSSTLHGSHRPCWKRGDWAAKISATIVLFLTSASLLLAVDPAIGKWVARDYPDMTLNIEPFGKDGIKLTYRLKLDAKTQIVMTVESPLNGADVPLIVDGKPSGQTMGIKKVDSHHSVTVLKFNGKQFGTSRAELSADGKTLTEENDVAEVMPNFPKGKTINIWDRR